MTDFKSHSRVENELAHQFRERLSHAESAEEARRFFSLTMFDLLERVLGEDAGVRQDDVILTESGFRASERLAALGSYTQALKDSDLEPIMRRFAEAASHRVLHMSNQPGKSLPSSRSHHGH